MAVSRIIKAVPVFFFLTASPLLANDSVFSIIGYYKNLFTQSRATDTEESYFVDLNRLRLQLNYKPTETFESVVAVDNEFFAHDAAGIGDFNNVRQKNERYLAAWDADYVSADKRHYYARHSLFRAYMKYSRPNFNVTVGKQGIDWSRMRFYAPLDLFNPVSPLDLERDERVGSDAVYAMDEEHTWRLGDRRGEQQPIYDGYLGSPLRAVAGSYEYLVTSDGSRQVLVRRGLTWGARLRSALGI